MMKRIIAFVVCVMLCVPALSSCKKTSAKYTEYSFDYFDTVTTVTGYAESPAEFESIAADVLAQLGEYHKLYTIYHRYEGIENLCTVNELVNGAHRTVAVDRRIIDLLLYAKEMYEKTGGKVNIAMGSVLSIWHDYRAEGSDEPWNAKLPPMEALLEAAKHTDIEDILIDEAQTKIFSAIQNNVKKDVQDIGKVINAALDELEKLQNVTGLSGVPSGFPSLDAITQGWQASDLIILAARPSVGKTAFVLNLARNAAVDHNMPVAFFSLEMPAIQLAKRMMVSETKLNADKFKGGEKIADWEWKQLDIQLKRLVKAPIYIDDTPSLPIMEFRSKVKRLVNQKGVRLVVVDYLQLMQGPAELRGMREQEVAAISRMLKATAKELNVPIIALSQLSRNAENRQGGNRRPQLSDLRESGSIEQDADMVVFIHRFDYQGLSENAEDIGRTQIIIAKHRNGAIADVDMKFRADEVRFVDLTDTVYAHADNLGVDSAMNSDAYPPVQDTYDAYPPDGGFGGEGSFA